MTMFVILTRQRSGSTFLKRYLSSHPQIACFGEIFLDKLDSPNTYYAYRQANSLRKIGHLVQRKRTTQNYLEWIYTHPESVRAVGFKLMYGQARANPSAVSWLTSRSVRVIHLVRENALKSIASAAAARERGQSHSTSKLGPVSVRLDPEKTLKRLGRMVRERELYRRKLSSCPMLELSYESLCENRASETERVLDFLGVDQNTELSGGLTKQSSDSLADFVANYDDLVEVLSGTEFKRFLD